MVGGPGPGPGPGTSSCNRAQVVFGAPAAPAPPPHTALKNCTCKFPAFPRPTVLLHALATCEIAKENTGPFARAGGGRGGGWLWGCALGCPKKTAKPPGFLACLVKTFPAAIFPLLPPQSHPSPHSPAAPTHPQPPLPVQEPRTEQQRLKGREEEAATQDQDRARCVQVSSTPEFTENRVMATHGTAWARVGP